MADQPGPAAPAVAGALPANQGALGVALFHPDSRSNSRRGIYSYAVSLIAGVRQAGYRTSLVTDLPDCVIKKDPGILHREIAAPTHVKSSSLTALPAYMSHWLTPGRRARGLPVNRQIPLDERNDYLQDVDQFLNIPNFYEVCRLAGNKPMLPPADVSIVSNHGCRVALTATPMALKAPGAALIQTVHDLIILNQDVHDLSRSKFQRRLEACIAHADLIAAVSEHTRSEILQRYPHAESRIQVLYQPLPANEPSINASADVGMQNNVLRHFGLAERPYIFFIGAVEQRKNVANLIRAYRQSKASAQCALVIAGPLDEAYAKAERIDHLLAPHTRPSADGIVYLGRISQIEKLCLLRRARLFAFPSITEGFGLPILEAQAMHCPVLTSNTSALPEVAGTAALMVNDPLDVDEITDALDKLALDDGLNARLAAEGEINARRFHRDRFAQRLGELIRMVT